MMTDRAEFTRLNAEGWTIPQLAEHFNIAPRSVTRLRTKLGVHGRRLDLTPDRLATIADMLAEGMSQHEVSRTTGVNRETIRAHFPGSGWNLSESKTFGNQTWLLWQQVEKANYARSAG
jgi:hypothetical protein